uniref:site-specific DNA-methyltransferase (adenine-specific) n=1 Tax=viral metagenome TaxID=1070528 RepID=A0A6M3JZI5_9ZZZZ
MQYLGGKAREAKEFARIIEGLREPNQVYIEPFVGGAWVLEQVSGTRYAYDINPYLIALYQAIQDGWQPPDEVTVSEYNEIRAGKPCPDYYRAFLGFGVSFGGKWFGGYAKNKRGDNYAARAKRGLLRLYSKLGDVHFAVADYRTLNPSGAIVYCDPPYKGCTKYDACADFDSLEFWETAKQWSKTNTVVVSEYTAPTNWICIWERPKKVSVRATQTARGTQDNRIERLFLYEP